MHANVQIMIRIAKAAAFWPLACGLCFAEPPTAAQFNAVEQQDIRSLDSRAALIEIDASLASIENLLSQAMSREPFDESFKAVEQDIKARSNRFAGIYAKTESLEDGEAALLLTAMCKAPADQTVPRVERFLKLSAQYLLIRLERDDDEEFSREQIKLFPQFAALGLMHYARMVAGCEVPALKLMQVLRKNWQFESNARRAFFTALADTATLGMEFRIEQQGLAQNKVSTRQILQALDVLWAARLEEFRDFNQTYLAPYRADLQRITALRAPPLWRVNRKQSGKLATDRFSSMVNWRISALSLPGMPSPTELLYAEGKKHAAAAWALAVLFRTAYAERSDSVLSYAAFVHAAYGKKATQDELQRAARSIKIIPRIKGAPLAFVTLFGHELPVESGIKNYQSGEQSIEIYDAQKIEAQFRQSQAYQTLNADLPPASIPRRQR